MTMKKNKEIEKEFSEMIPNPAGIPAMDENSETLRKEHNRWKGDVAKNACKEFSELHYWEKESVCTAL